MNKEELKTLLDALFPEATVDDTSVNTMRSRLPHDPRAGLGYAVRQTEGDKKIMETVRRLDGSDRKTAAMNNSEVHRTLDRSAATHARANSSLSKPSSSSRGLEPQSKLTSKPSSVSFFDRILRKIKR